MTHRFSAMTAHFSAIATHLQVLVLITAAAAVFSSCSDDDHTPAMRQRVQLPTTGQPVVGIVYSGNCGQARDWTFSYTSGRPRVMEAAISTAKDATNPAAVQRNTFRLSYHNDNITVSSGSNQYPIALKMSADGLLASATSGTTTYAYSYAAGYLASWQVTYRNESAYGPQTQKGAAATLDWDINGTLRKIVYTADLAAPKETDTYAFTYEIDGTPTSHLNTNGLLPEMISKAYGCEGMEFLYYAGMLGKGPVVLPAGVTITHTNAVGDQTATDYQYIYQYQNVQTDAGTTYNISHCEFRQTGSTAMGAIAQYSY